MSQNENKTNNFRTYIIHFLKVIPFYLFVCAYFHFIFDIPKLISDFTYNKHGFLLIFIFEIILLFSVIYFLLKKFKLKSYVFFAQLFVVKILYGIPLIIIFYFSTLIFNKDFIPKHYIGISRYVQDVVEDRNGQIQNEVKKFPEFLIKSNDESFRNYENITYEKDENRYIKQKFYFWESAIIYGFDVSPVADIDSLANSKKVLLNFSLLPFLILEYIIDGVPMVIILLCITIVCYFFNYMFPFKSYSSLIEYMNDSIKERKYYN